MTDLDPAYIAARRTLIDVLIALSPHADAIVVVGAHAVYLRTGDSGIAVAPYTTDADLAVNPAVLDERPALETLLKQAGFVREPSKPGAWTTGDSAGHAPIPIDIMVPAGVAPGNQSPKRAAARTRQDGHSTCCRTRAIVD